MSLFKKFVFSVLMLTGLGGNKVLSMNAFSESLLQGYKCIPVNNDVKDVFAIYLMATAAYKALRYIVNQEQEYKKDTNGKGQMYWDGLALVNPLAPIRLVKTWVKLPFYLARVVWRAAWMKDYPKACKVIVPCLAVFIKLVLIGHKINKAAEANN